MTTARSDKPFKAAEHRRERSAVRQTLGSTGDDAAVPPTRAFGDPWRAPKDGKAWMPVHVDRQCWMRK
ncbi:hypothetical protein [Thermomonas sp.]|uniref:hypothetical protein n=1 Tax=Thermomonas sp. TaxID=1971895 RepID=UPI0035B00471